jgi:hypothetical protein
MLSSTVRKDSILVSEHSAHKKITIDISRVMSQNQYVAGDSHSFIKNTFKRILTAGLDTVK